MALIPIWFALPQDDPEDPTYVIRVKTKHGNARGCISFVLTHGSCTNADLGWNGFSRVGLPTKIRAGAMLGRPFVFSMEDCGYPFYFCARTDQYVAMAAGTG